MTEPLLVTTARDVMEGRSGLQELTGCWEMTCRDLAGERERILQDLEGESEAVQARVLLERRALEDSFSDFLSIAEICRDYFRDFDKGRLETIIRDLPLASARLELDMVRLFEAVGAARGPTPHGGINRVLARAHVDAANLADECEVESARLEAWLEGLEDTIPEPLWPDARRFGEELLTWLEERPDDLLEPWLDRGARLGALYADCDPQFLWRQYSAGPTGLGHLNVALNAAWLMDQGLMSPPMVRYALDSLRQQLMQLPGAPEGAPEPVASAAAELAEVSRELGLWLGQMVRWVEAPERSALQPMREMAVDLAQELMHQLERLPQLETPCAACGQPRPLGSVACPSCGKEAPPALSRVARLAALADTQSWSSLELELESFRADLDRLQDQADKNAASEDYRAALRLLGRGCELLEECLERQDTALLGQAAPLLSQGEEALKALQTSI